LTFKESFALSWHGYLLSSMVVHSIKLHAPVLPAE
jgi:hypothetical protein